MLETFVIGFAIAVCVALLALAFWVARASQANLERRARDAAAGGRPLSLDEQTKVARRVRDELAIPALRASDPNFDRKGPDEAAARGAHPDWAQAVKRRQKIATAGVVLSIGGGLVLGSIAADGLDVDGMGRVLIGGAATFLIAWCLLGTMILVRKRQDQA